VDSAFAPTEGGESLKIQLDWQRHQAFFGRQSLGLTPTEFRILDILLRSCGQVLSRSELCRQAIADGAVVLERTIDVHICSLRRKLRPYKLIQTIRKRGYCIQDQVTGIPQAEIKGQEPGTGASLIS
jgi:two-component system phosphate regulon response regulator PhoB